MKLCVLFPGIGYHCDKPLLYYTAKLARSLGYDVIPLKYQGFDVSAKDNEEKMRSAAELAFKLSEEQLADADFSAYQRVVFVGKSIGTAAALRYRAEHGINAGTVLFTPLAMTFDCPADGSIAFHGTSDPWVETAALETLCGEQNVPLYKYPKANHSLETGDVFTDLGCIHEVMGLVSEYLK